MSRSVIVQWSVGAFGAGPYPERSDTRSNRLDRWAGAWLGRAGRGFSALRRADLSRFAGEVEREAPGLRGMTDEALRAAVDDARERIRREGLPRALAARIFALVQEASARRLGLRHYPVQLMGGYAMLRGYLAEMQTGEGKTLTAALPAVAVALARIPVHVVTVNEYLARRDAEQLKPLYEFFGVTVGYVTPGEPPAARREAYERDVTYCINKDLVFDYLRDRLASARVAGARAAVRRVFEGREGSGRATLRGLYFAIIDEADSILVDEARTPLIISADAEDTVAAEDYRAALELAAGLRDDEFDVSATERSVRLAPAGRTRLEDSCAGMAGLWRFKKAREEIVEQALAALRLYQRDRNYLVADGKVRIVDEFTGRTMADRSWERGLHQLIEVKEGLDPSPRRETIGRITYQRFFRRYLWLAGMSGTATEVAPELRAVFALSTTVVPPNRPLRRTSLGERIFVHADARWHAVVDRVREMRAAGRAVLVGTRSVEASERLSELLARESIDHAVLNARQDQEEAQIVAMAGQPGRVTVATNMAGRGTDIVLHPRVRDAGGLHVILTEFHESRRIDRQLFGRAGRQGDPGSYESCVSLEDELFRNFAGDLSRWLAPGRTAPDALLGATSARLLRWYAQGRAQHLHAHIRRRTLESDHQTDRSLAFSGRGE